MAAGIGVQLSAAVEVEVVCVKSEFGGYYLEALVVVWSSAWILCSLSLAD